MLLREVGSANRTEVWYIEGVNSDATSFFGNRNRYFGTRSHDEPAELSQSNLSLGIYGTRQTTGTEQK